MSCIRVTQRELDESRAYQSLQMVSGVIAGISILTCLIALSILLNNHVRTAVWQHAFDHITVLKPETVNLIVSIAKWTGISGACTATFLGGLYFFKLTRSAARTGVEE